MKPTVIEKEEICLICLHNPCVCKEGKSIKDNLKIGDMSINEILFGKRS